MSMTRVERQLFAAVCGLIEAEVDLEACGDAGHWNVESMPHIIKARAAQAAYNFKLYKQEAKKEGVPAP